MAKSYSTFSDMAASNFASISGPTKSTKTSGPDDGLRGGSSKAATSKGIMSFSSGGGGDDGGGSKTTTKQVVSQQTVSQDKINQGSRLISGGGLGSRPTAPETEIFVAGDPRLDASGFNDMWFSNIEENTNSFDMEEISRQYEAEVDSFYDRVRIPPVEQVLARDPSMMLPQITTAGVDPLLREGSTRGPSSGAIATGLEVVQALDVDAKARATDTSVSTQAYAVGDLREAQAQLKDLNLYRSTVDGLGGRQTANAIKTFQYRAGIPVTGELDTATREALGSTDIPRDQRPEDFSDPLLAVLSEGENTTYSSANDYDSRRGRPAWGVYGSYYSDRYNKPISEMTIGEIMDIQSGGYGNREVFAVGAYQVIPNTMIDTVERMGISEDTVFDAETQNAIGRDLLLNKPGRGNLRAYLLGEEGASEEAALLDLAKEWASIPVPSTGDSYYEGQSAHVPLAEVRQALREQRNIIMKEYGRTFESEE